MVRAKIEKTHFLVGPWLGLGQKKKENTRFGKALVRVRAKIEKNTVFGRGLVKIREK